MSTDTALDLSGDEKTQFSVHLVDFDGPFDVLLQMIAKHKLDVTHISLSTITDEFIEYVKDLQKDNHQLDELSSFVLIAATLLDIKCARLLPGQENFNDEDLELLEARDLLFAKLLQFKAFKDVSLKLAERLEIGHGRYARNLPLEPHFAALLPELQFESDTREIVMLAASAFANFSYRNQGVSLSHIHMRQVNVAEQGVIISKRLIAKKKLTFAELVKDAKHPVIIIGRFLSLLELYKMNAISFDQKKALSELTINWIAPENFDPEKQLTGSDFDTPITASTSPKAPKKTEKKGKNGENNK